MSNNISFTIPLEASMLRHTITMLESALADIEDAPVLKKAVAEVLAPDPTLEGLFDVTVTPTTDELDPKIIFGEAPQFIENVETDVVKAYNTGQSAIPTPAEIPTPLDNLQCPWDERINVSTRTRRKSDNSWTLLRGVDPAYVEQVRAEIRQGGITPPPVSDTEPAVVDAFTDALSKVTSWLTSPQRAGFKVKMDMLLNSKGLASFAGLMSQQELIPEIMPLLEAEWNTLK